MRNRFGTKPGSTQQLITPSLSNGDTFAWFGKNHADIPKWKRRLAGYKAGRRNHPVKITLAGQS